MAISFPGDSHSPWPSLFASGVPEWGRSKLAESRAFFDGGHVSRWSLTGHLTTRGLGERPVRSIGKAQRLYHVE
jgi:hypothetical protein